MRQTASTVRAVVEVTLRGSALLPGLGAQPILGLAQLGGEVLAEVLRCVQRTDLNLRAAVERGSLEPLDRLLDRR